MIKLFPGILLLAMGSALAACASGAPPAANAPAAAVAAPGATAATAEAAAPKQAGAKLPSYKRVTRNGQELYCRSQKVTNSLTRKVEVCLTQAQMDAQKEGVRDFIRQGQSTTGPGPQ